MNESYINQPNENIFNNKYLFSNENLYPLKQNVELLKPLFIRKETTLVEQPYPDIDYLLQQCNKGFEEQAIFFNEYFQKVAEKKQIEWLTISHASAKMINYNIISKIHVTGKSLFQAYFTSFTSFEKKKSDPSIEIFANSEAEFEYCYFVNSKITAIVVRDFSSAKFKNCIFENNNISVFISNNSYAEFENCLFLNDTNTTIFSSKKCQIKIKNCQFKGVTKSIYSKDEVTIRIDDTKFNNCNKGAATISNKSILMMNNIIVNNSSNTAFRSIDSIVKAKNIVISNTKGNALNLENTNGYFYNCKMTKNVEYPTIAIKGKKSNPVFSKCNILDNGKTFAVVIKNCSRPLFDNCLFTKCDSNCFSISDFSMPVIRNCNFMDISKFWINVYGKSIVTLDGDYEQDKINFTKNSKIINEEQRKEEEVKYVVYENDIAKNNYRESICNSWKPLSYKDVPKVDDMIDPDGMFEGKLTPLSLVSIEKIMNDDDLKPIDIRCCNHNHDDENEIYVSAQCGHCFCKNCQNVHSRCPVCDSPVRSLKKLFKQEQCVICMDRAATTVITSCGHMCMCYECAVKCSEQKFNCPLCNQPIVSYRYMCNE